MPARDAQSLHMPTPDVLTGGIQWRPVEPIAGVHHMPGPGTAC